MRLARLALPFVLSLVLAPARLPADGPPAGDLARLQGTRRGTLLGPTPGIQASLTMEVRADGSFLWDLEAPKPGRNVRIEGRLKLNESTDPRQIDLLDVTSDGEGRPDVHGIYRLDGETLLLAFPDRPDGDRPVAFPDDPRRRIVLERLEPAG